MPATFSSLRSVWPANDYNVAMIRFIPRTGTWLLVIGMLLAIGGCQSPRVNNTRLGGEDLVAMTDQMVMSLMNAEAVADRDSASPPWVIAADRVVNRAADIIPDREKHAFVARLRALLNASSDLKQRNIVFVQDVERSGEGRMLPTHSLTATFYAATEYSREVRADAYVCAYQLLDLRNDQVMWEDRYEVKRQVIRHAFD